MFVRNSECYSLQIIIEEKLGILNEYIIDLLEICFSFDIFEICFYMYLAFLRVKRNHINMLEVIKSINTLMALL